MQEECNALRIIQDKKSSPIHAILAEIKTFDFFIQTAIFIQSTANVCWFAALILMAPSVNIIVRGESEYELLT